MGKKTNLVLLRKKKQIRCFFIYKGTRDEP
jgi:hypothetical protein